MKTRAFIGLGSNLGEKREYLARARQYMAELPGITIIRESSLYLTAPWGNTDQDHFLNQVIEIDTETTAAQLLRQLQDIEIKLGRRRTEKWGPRTIDLDILLFGEETIAEDHLVVPHPRMMQRLFVLVPLAEISPELVLPDGTGIREVLARVVEREKEETVRKT